MCYQDSDMDRPLPEFKKNVNAVMVAEDISVLKCTSHCYASLDYSIAGIEIGNTCFCGTGIELSRTKAKLLGNDRCAVACPDKTGDSCGGLWEIAIFDTPAGRPHSVRV